MGVQVDGKSFNFYLKFLPPPPLAVLPPWWTLPAIKLGGIFIKTCFTGLSSHYFEKVFLPGIQGEMEEVSEYFWSTNSQGRWVVTLDVRNQIGVTNFVVDLFFPPVFFIRLKILTLHGQ